MSGAPQLSIPLRTIRDLAPRTQGRDRTLLVMLPGAGEVPEGFARHGFVQALRERELTVDAIMVDAHLDYYLERSITSRLTSDVILPALADCYAQIWLMGISLGGMGALMCARNQPAAIDGVILLAPYLANRGMIAEIVRGGGLDAWRPAPVAQQDDEQALLAWIKAFPCAEEAPPAIYLAYGTADRFAGASELLAQRLPAGRVVAVPGDHDWETWGRAWRCILDLGLFSGGSTLAPRSAQAAST